MPTVKLLVLGGSGGTGRQIVGQALDAGHDVTVVTREPGKLALHHPHLKIVSGDTTAGGAALTGITRGQDAVISTIGRGKTFRSDGLIQRSVPAILGAMQTAGVRRLMFTSALGVGDTFRDSPILPKVFFKTLLRDIYADKLAGDDLIRASGLDWTIVQPSVLTDGALTRKYRSGEHLPLSGMPSISRADTAHYILDRLNDTSTVGKTIILSN